MTLVNHQPQEPKTFMTWLGRQVAHIKHALHADPAPYDQQVIYRTLDTKEQPHPEHPNVTLRRTTIDEAIITKEGRSLNDPGQK